MKIAMCRDPYMCLYMIDRTLVFDVSLDGLIKKEINRFENGRQVTIFNCDFFNRFGIGITPSEARNDLIRSIKLYLDSLVSNKQLIAFLRKRGFEFVRSMAELPHQQEIKLIDRRTND